MSVFDTLKGAFFEDAPATQDNTGAPTKASVIPEFKAPSWEHSILPSTKAPARTDENTLRILKSRIYPGSGPLSVFLATFNSLASAIPDETTRLTAAINVCVAQGGSIGGILADIGTANTRLTGEQQMFETQRTTKLSTEVGSRDARLVQLSQQIQALTNERDQLALETQAMKDEINTKTVNYKAALSQIAADLDAMEQKLKGAK